MGVVELRPLSTGELLDKTFSLYRNHFLLFVGIMAVPGLIPLIAGLLFGGMSSMGARPAAQVSINTPLAILSALIVGLAYMLAYAVALAATIFAVSDLYLGNDTGILHSFARVGGKALRVLWMLFLLMMAMGLGFILLFVPGVLVAVWYAVAIPAAVIENLKTGAAFRRSEKLTKGRRWNILLVFILCVLLNYVVLIVFNLPAGMLQIAWPGFISQLIGSLATFVSNALVGPFLTISLSLMYYDLRVRKEGFDLQLLLSALGPGVPATATI